MLSAPRYRGIRRSHLVPSVLRFRPFRECAPKGWIMLPSESATQHKNDRQNLGCYMLSSSLRSTGQNEAKAEVTRRRDRKRTALGYTELGALKRELPRTASSGPLSFEKFDLGQDVWSVFRVKLETTSERHEIALPG